MLLLGYLLGFGDYFQVELPGMRILVPGVGLKEGMNFVSCWYSDGNRITVIINSRQKETLVKL